MDASTPSPCVILNEPQLAENIGAVARVMANFGLSDLRLVRPRDGWPQERAWACASGADWPLNDARVFDRLEDAAADLQRLYATTARPRETRLPILTPREAAGRLSEATGQGLACGFLFGGERAGLETADIALCQAIITVPIDPRFRSLNLAQAVAINAYEWRMTVQDRPPPAFRAEDAPADQAELVGFYEHLERELDASGFFFPPEKRPSMVRNLRVIFARSVLSSQETRTLRGVLTALTKGRGRVLARLARERAEAASAAETETEGGGE
jgi:tRNA/rRNA methyltransferase